MKKRVYHSLLKEHAQKYEPYHAEYEENPFHFLLLSSASEVSVLLIGHSFGTY